MADRRKGDRREKEKGIIKITFKRLIVCLILAIILIAQLVLNIILFKTNKKYEKIIEGHNIAEYTADDDDYDVDDDNNDYDDDEIDNDNAND